MLETGLTQKLHKEATSLDLCVFFQSPHRRLAAQGKFLEQKHGCPATFLAGVHSLVLVLPQGSLRGPDRCHFDA